MNREDARRLRQIINYRYIALNDHLFDVVICPETYDPRSIVHNVPINLIIEGIPFQKLINKCNGH